MKWLIANRCDLGQPLVLLAGDVRAVADSSRMTGFADTLETLARQVRSIVPASIGTQRPPM